MTKTQFIKAANTSDYVPWCISKNSTSLCGKIGAGEARDTTSEEPKRKCCKCTWVSLGYEVKTIQAGQVRRYGPTVNSYCITDVTGGREKDEVLTFCRSHVKRAKMCGEEGYHPLQSHVMHFSQRADGAWLYKCGHEYTG